jgi:rare lipoprotein A
VSAPPAPVDPDRALERADRSERITAAPETTPSAAPSSAAPTPTKTASKPSPAPPQGGGSVVNSGTCKASYYTDQGSPTASGVPFDVNQLWAAHKTLPFNTVVRVTNTANGKTVDVVIKDRGPYTAGRCLDLTPRAFDAIANRSAGVITVKYEVLGR